MANVQFNTVREKLIRRARIQQSSNLRDPDYTDLIESAVLLHNSSYSLTQTSSTVPVRETDCIIVLAWREYLIWRATEYALQANATSSSGFGTDRNTPYYKCMDLADKLATQYINLCTTLGLAVFANLTGGVGGGAPEIVEASTENAQGLQTPLTASPMPPAPTITNTSFVVSGAGELIVSFSFDPAFAISELDRYENFYLQGSEPIYQGWNFGSELCPFINPAASKTGFDDPYTRSFKLTGLDPTSGITHRILMTALSASGKRSYSAEAVFTQA